MKTTFEKITVLAPTRVDLIGGTLDLWPIHCVFNQSTTINFGVEAFAKVEIKPSGNFKFVSNDLALKVQGDFNQVIQDKKLPLISTVFEAYWPDDAPGIEITTEAMSPAGAGLGGSSCLAVALAKGLLEARKLIVGDDFEQTDAEIVCSVQNIEAKLIHTPTGCQDYWGGMFGGMNIIKFPHTGVQVDHLDQPPWSEWDLDIVLCHSGKTRKSAINNWEVYKKVFDGDKEMIEKLSQIADLSFQAGEFLLRNEMMEFLDCCKQEWNIRKKLWPNITTPEIDEFLQVAESFDVPLARVCGAGGGGVLAFVVAVKDKQLLIDKLIQAKGQILSAGFAKNGVQVDVK